MISVTGKSDTIRSLKGYHSLHNIINHEIYFYKSFVFVLNVLPCFLILLDKYRISFRLTWNSDGIAINLPAYLAGLPEEA